MQKSRSKDSREKKNSAAHHEAGHAVRAHLEGAPPTQIILQWNDDDKAWDGDVSGFQESDVKVTSRILIAYAGPLAEIKFRARLQLGQEAVFDATVETDDLLRYLQDPDEYESDFDPHVSVTFIVGNETRNLRSDLRPFSDDALKAHAWAKGNGERIRRLLVRARKQIDEASVWHAIEKLAAALIARPVKRGRIAMPAKQAQFIIKTALKRT
jgi:hypothetical protein